MRRGIARACIGALVVAAVASSMPAAGSRTVAQHGAARPGSAPRFPSTGKIKHVVLIFQENRSFDEVLGAFCVRRRRCDGSIGPVRLKDGSVQPMTQSPDVVWPDPPHNSVTQYDAMDGGKMDGWGDLGGVCESPGANSCLTYYAPSQVPALTAYASKYVVSDKTFSMQNAPSWGGHMWPATSSQDGFTGDIPWNGIDDDGGGWGCDSKRVALWISPTHQASLQPSCIPAPAGALDPARYPYGGAFKATPVPSVPTIFDRLDAAHLPWKLYTNIYIWSICPTFAKCLYTSQRKNMVAPTRILSDAKNGTLPAYSVLLPTGPSGDTGQHPPSSMLSGDNWIARVVNALQAGPQWSSTAIFITYDDCGCFYDHVPPGKNPDGTLQGIREPMVIISPYAKRAGTDSTPTTLNALLKFVEETFGLAPLGVNDAQAYDYAKSFDFTVPGTAPRVWPKQQPVPQVTQRLVAALPPDPNDPT